MADDVEEEDEPYETSLLSKIIAGIIIYPIAYTIVGIMTIIMLYLFYHFVLFFATPWW